MNIQHERIETLCTELKLATVAESYPEHAQECARENRSHVDLLEAVLSSEKACAKGEPDTP